LSQWSDRLEKHALWANLQTIGAALDAAQARKGIDAAALDAIARCRSVLAFIDVRLRGADGELVAQATLDAINGQFKAARNEVNNFASNGNAAHLTNANNQLDSALVSLAQVHVRFTPEDFRAAREAAESYRQGLGTALAEAHAAGAQVRAEVEAHKARIAELTTHVNAEKQRLSTLAADYQSQFSTAQEARIRQSAALHKEQQDGFVALVTEHTKAFATKAAEFTSMLTEARQQHAAQLASLSRSFTEEAEVVRKGLLNRKAEVEKLVGIIGNLALTAGYQKAAKAARFATRIWQGVTVLAMIGFVAVALYVFLPALANGFAWSSFAGRVFISLTVGVLAAYAARQADRYQQFERRSEKMALELEALGPFLAPLPAEKQESFRLTVGDRSFGRDEAPHSATNRSPASVADLIGDKDLRTLLIELVKASSK
jgi:hypothetical protein